MDVGLGLSIVFTALSILLRRLNPCFSGCWSRTCQSVSYVDSNKVLILVLVDVGLGHVDTGVCELPKTKS